MEIITIILGILLMVIFSIAICTPLEVQKEWHYSVIKIAFLSGYMIGLFIYITGITQLN